MDNAGGTVRVLYFTRSYNVHDIRFLSALARTDHNVHSLALYETAPDGVTAGFPPGVKTSEPLYNIQSLKWSKYPQAARRLSSQLDVIQPDLIHAGPIHICAAIAAMTGFKPLVSMSWGSDLLWEARKPLVALVSRLTLSRSNAFVGDCEAVAAAANRLGMARNKIVLFPWGTDLEHFTPGPGDKVREKLGWQQAFILLSTRSFEPLYGVDLIVRAFIEAAADNPALHLLLVGGGSLQKQFEEQLHMAGLDARSHFAGRVDRQALPNYYRAADLYLSASYSDGSSVSLLEAMACGLPPLVSDIPGNREWVEPGISGWLFQAGEVKSLIGSLIKHAQDESALKKTGAAARSVVERSANWKRNFPRLLEAYELARRDAGQAAA